MEKDNDMISYSNENKKMKVFSCSLNEELGQI
jgi:hypothetical protein